MVEIGKNYGHSMQTLIVALIIQVTSGYMRDCIVVYFPFSSSPIYYLFLLSLFAEYT